MARVNTNNTSLRFCREQTVGVLPVAPAWRISEFESISNYGATLTTVVRRPIGQDRGRKKGTVVDLESAVEFESDFTADSFTDFGEGFMFAEFANVEFDLKSAGAPPVPTALGYTIDVAGATLAAKMVWAAGGAITLVYAKGYATAANNGLKPLTADVGAADVNVAVAGNVAEAVPPTSASLQVAGLRTDDLVLTIDAGLATGSLVSAADVTWTVLGIFPGQIIHIGSATAAGVLQNAPTIAAATVSGFCRVRTVTALTITFDKPTAGLVAAGAGASPGAQPIDVMFGRFLRNVPVTANATDNRFLERTFQFECAFPDLGGVGTDEYEYAIGNFANELTINLALADKVTSSFGFVGTNSDVITAVRKLAAATAVAPLRTVAFNTASGLASLTTDVISAVSDVCFKSLTVTINNNVTPEKCLGVLGASFVNSGMFEVNLEGQMLFTRKEIINAIRNNTTVTFQMILRNEDGAIALDMPEATFGGGGREYPMDASVLVNITGMSFTSSTFGYDMGVSLFANVPWA